MNGYYPIAIACLVAGVGLGFVVKDVLGRLQTIPPEQWTVDSIESEIKHKQV